MPRAVRRKATTLKPALPALTSPWLTATQAGAYLHRGRRFVLREIHAGRIRAAVVGGRREVLARTNWCDAWVTDQALEPERHFGGMRKTR